MEHLIKEALAEEAAGAPFPADAWQRQEALLAEAGLFGEGAPAVQPRRGRFGWLGQAAAVAALLVLTLGTIGLRPWGVASRPGPSSVTPVQPKGWVDEAGAFQLPDVKEMTALRLPNRLREYEQKVGGAEAEATWERLKAWLSRGEVIGQLDSWAPSAHTAPIYLEAGDRTFTLQAGDSCYGVYDPTECYTLVGLPEGGAAMIIQRDLSFWLDGRMWDSSVEWLSTKFEPEGESLFGEGQAAAAAQAHFAETGYPGLVAERVERKLRYSLVYDAKGDLSVSTLRVWNVVLQKPGDGEGQWSIVLPDNPDSKLGPFSVRTTFYEAGSPIVDRQELSSVGSLLARENWQIGPEDVTGIQPVNGTALDRSWDRPDPKLDLVVPKLLRWLGEARVIQDSVPDAEVSNPYLVVNLKGGGRIWFSRHVSCWSAVEPDCTFVIGGDGRESTLIEQPDLWRWLVGNVWHQDLLSARFPATGRFEWTGPLHRTEESVRQQIEADHAVKAAGREISSMRVQARYVQRQEPDGAWRIDERPVWIVYLGPGASPETLSEILMIDDQTGEELWRSTEIR